MYELPTTVALALVLVMGQGQDAFTADELWDAGRRVEALEHMARDLARQPEDRALRLRLVRRELSVQRYAAALQHAELLGHEHDALRGRALYFLTRYAQALPLLPTDDTETLPLHLESLRALGRFDAIDALIPRAVDLLGAHDTRVLLLRARRHVRTDELAEAAQVFRRAVQTDPLEPEALFGLGRTLVRLGQRVEGLELLERHRALMPLLDAVDAAQRAVQLAPLHAPHHAALGDALRPLLAFAPDGDSRVTDAYSQAARLANGRDEVVAVALRHARHVEEDLDDRERALRVLEEALKRFDDARLHVRAADVQVRRGLRDEALEHLRAALELRPTDRAIRERIEALEGGGR